MQAKETINKLVKDQDIKELFDQVKLTNHQLSFNCHDFESNHFQTYVATKILADRQTITLTVLPTGAGKSYIAAIVAKHLIG